MARPLRILHLEDDPRDTELMEAALRSDGLDCEIVRVDTRDGFLKQLQSGRPDLIISDVSVPGFDGIRAQQVWDQLGSDIPFIFLSGTFGEEAAIERLKAGATDYVLKNWVEKLPAVVRRAMREMQDRSGRVEAQDELRKLNAELEQRVEERTAQLAQARKEADRANRAKSEFLSRMSHDLRTPLNAVLGFAQLLDTDNITADQRESVVQILQAGRHLLDLMNEVLDISRIESGHLSLSPEPVAVPEIVEQAVKLVRPLADARRITIDLTASAAQERYVKADRQRLTQILLNLVSNAIKYNREGGRVTLSCAEQPDGRVRIQVNDTGAGIRPEKIALLFTPFERLGADQTSIEGTGLGLALSRGLAEAMGGKVGVDSQVDVGSTFWVELSMASPTTDRKPSNAASPPPPAVLLITGTVLYIEDNASNVRLLERLLKQRRPGITLMHAAEGALGVDIAQTHQPGLIFLDLHLPDIPGEEILRLLWTNQRTRDIPVVVLSADATVSQSRRLIASGAAAYLTKPLDVSHLLAVLDERFG